MLQLHVCDILRVKFGMLQNKELFTQNLLHQEKISLFELFYVSSKTISFQAKSVIMASKLKLVGW